MKKLINWFRMYSTGVVVPDNTESVDLEELKEMFAAEESEECDEN